MKKHLLFFLSLCLSLASVAQKPSKKSFQATCPELAGGHWKAGEQINVYDSNPEGLVYTANADGAQTFFMGKGACTSDDGYWCAVYPASALHLWSPQYLHFQIPNQQVADLGKIPAGTAIMYSCTSGYTMDFKPLVGYVRFVIGDNMPAIREVRLHTSKYISGHFKVKLDAEQTKVVNGGGARYRNVVLKPEQAGGVMAPGDYRLALYSRIFPEGMSLEFIAADGRVAIKTFDEKITIGLGHIFNLGVVDNLKFFDKQALYGSAYGDEGVVFWIDPADPYKGKIVSAYGEKRTWDPSVCEQLSQKTGKSWRLPSLEEATAIYNTYYGLPQDDPRKAGEDFSMTVSGMVARKKFDASMNAIAGSVPLEAKGVNGDSICTDQVSKNDDRRVHYVRMIVYSNGSAMKSNTDRYLRCVRDVELEYGE